MTQLDFYTTTTLAQAAGVDPGYIRQLLIAKRIKGEKPGGRDWIIAKEEGDCWLATRKSDAEEPELED